MTEQNNNTVFDGEQKQRCRDCAYLVEGRDGEWICDDCDRNIYNIPDNECSANETW